jgi:hypothetical protein
MSEPLTITYDTLGDTLEVGLYVGVNEDELPRPYQDREIDAYRHLAFDKHGRLLSITFLFALKRGVDLRGVPEAERIAAGLEALKKTLGLVLVS